MVSLVTPIKFAISSRLIGRWIYNANAKEFSYSGQTGIMCTEAEQSILLSDYLNFILPEDRDSFSNWLVQNLKGNMEESWCLEC